jgi:hypothetical protein
MARLDTHVYWLVGAIAGTIRQEYVCSEDTYREKTQTNEWKVICSLYDNKYDWYYILHRPTGKIIARKSGLIPSMDFILNEFNEAR